MNASQPELERTLWALHHALVAVRFLAQTGGSVEKIARAADVLEVVPIYALTRPDATELCAAMFEDLATMDPIFEMALRAYRGEGP